MCDDGCEMRYVRQGIGACCEMQALRCMFLMLDRLPSIRHAVRRRTLTCPQPCQLYALAKLCVPPPTPHHPIHAASRMIHSRFFIQLPQVLIHCAATSEELHHLRLTIALVVVFGPQVPRDRLRRHLHELSGSRISQNEAAEPRRHERALCQSSG